MKKVLVLIFALILVISVVGCSDSVGYSQPKPTDKRFVSVGDSYQLSDRTHNVVYDSKTNIVYMVDNDAYAGGAVVLYNSEGMPMKIDEYYKTR